MSDARPHAEDARGAPAQAAARRMAVALHGIEPASFERCALIRDWLCDHGVDRVTLLVIPARDLHPLGSRSPDMVEWLRERRSHGDAIAQHGFHHAPCRRRARLHLTARASGEFVGLDEDETRRAVRAGWRLLKLAGIEPDGFVAPAYAYTPQLRATLGGMYRWWASLLRVHVSHSLQPGARGELAPAWRPGARGPVRRALSPALVRAGALAPVRTLRLDVHPADLEHPRQILALEAVLERSAPRRVPITYEQLAVPGRCARRESRKLGAAGRV